ncbi:trypsin-like serine peptidase [Spirosoma montaniterrae]|uniref:Serine protease n=1 Tax=Spirosoma montaniterrae TaxID=1178516 RepID=A0A1P9WYB9_9BACT|nr:trypsin-like peptidase domain-containing protein [Spirosoma montaniterrae]AQG80369.1 hypothetical protein AWR27_14185 [Spirosoma montaniterrae]
MNTPPNTLPENTPDNPLAHYRRLLKAREHRKVDTESLESLESTEPDLSDTAIHDRLSQTAVDWQQIVRQHLGDASELHQIAQKIVTDADEALRVVRDDDQEALRRKPDILQTLEAIVRTDGSRPTFMVRNGRVDKSTSPLGDWSDSLDASADLLQDAIACVGRINDPQATQGFQGTGFLVANNLIVTNRHVLQVIARKQADRSWQLRPGVNIDFGHEFRARDSVNRRTFRRVVFAGAQFIDGAAIDHNKLDLVLIELEPAAPGQLPRRTLAVDVSTDWPQPELGVYTIGYPATPPNALATASLLEQLFQSTFGCKRLAPGRLMTSEFTAPALAAHDATTLGGNSGSAIVVIGRELSAAGLHYGGRSREPRENWSHVLGRVLDESEGPMIPAGQTPRTLRERLTDFGVEFRDRATSPAV